MLRIAVAAMLGMITASAAGAAGAGGRTLSLVSTGRISARVAAVADFNGDGVPDLVVLTRGRIVERNRALSVEPGTVGVLLGDGAGGFSRAAASTATGGLAGSAAAADVNGDGKMDLVVANRAQPVDAVDDTVVGASNLRVLLGDGAGGFVAEPAAPELEGISGSVSVADLNGDGHLDLILPSAPVLLGDGTGRFARGPRAPAADSLGLGDFDGDGTVDVAVVVHGRRTISIQPGDGRGSFRAAVGAPALGDSAGSYLAIADFNRDGRDDIAVTVENGVTVLLRESAGGFLRAPGSPVATDCCAEDLAAGDFDRDGKLDLATKTGYGISVLAGDGTGAFPHTLRYRAEPIGALVAGVDVNRDHGVDLVLEHQLLFQTQSAPRTRSSAAVPSASRATFSTRGRIAAIAADERRVAAATSGRGGPRFVVWAAPGRTSMTLADQNYGSRDCDSGSESGLALGRGRVGWIIPAGGNTLELRVRVAPASGGKPKTLEDVYSGPGCEPEGGWVANLFGGGALLAYNRWSVDCRPGSDHEYGCDWGWQEPVKTVVRIAGGRRIVVARGTLRAVGGGRMAVESEHGLDVLKPSGARIASVTTSAVSPLAVALSTTQLAVQTPFTLELYAPASGTKKKMLALGPAAALRLAGVSSRLALLRGAGRAVLLRLGDGRLVALPRTDIVDAKLTDAGLFYAYNEPKARLKGRIAFEPTAAVLARISRTG